MRKLKVLIGDDSIVYRALLKKILRSFPWIEITGSAADGEKVLTSIRVNNPDVVILDVEMPVMDGIGVMTKLNKSSQAPAVIMCSAFTTAGASVTIKALELGAYDFITKPDGKDRFDSEKQLVAQLSPLLTSLHQGLASFKSSKLNAESPKREKLQGPSAYSKKVDLICIGLSTGGPNALSQVIPQLPSTLSAPVVIVQHMPPLFISSLSNSLNKKSQLSVVEATDDQELSPGYVYFAPGQTQMGVEKRAGKYYAKISSDAPPENHCRPAVDYLFRSAAQESGDNTLGIIMTGMGADGAKGLKMLYDSGAYTVAQNEETCTIFGMPNMAIKADAVSEILPLDKIAAKIVSSLR